MVKKEKELLDYKDKLKIRENKKKLVNLTNKEMTKGSFWLAETKKNEEAKKNT